MTEGFCLIVKNFVSTFLFCVQSLIVVSNRVIFFIMESEKVVNVSFLVLKSCKYGCLYRNLHVHVEC